MLHCDRYDDTAYDKHNLNTCEDKICQQCIRDKAVSFFLSKDKFLLMKSVGRFQLNLEVPVINTEKIFLSQPFGRCI